MAEIKARLSRGWTKICQCLIILSILMSNCNELKTSKYSFVNLAPSSILVEASDNSNNSTQETRSNNDDNIVDIKHRDDEIDDGFFDPMSPDPSCVVESDDCWSPPKSSIEQETVVIDTTAMYGGDDPSDCFDDDNDESHDIESNLEGNNKQCKAGIKTQTVDKHWGSDENILKMRDQLRNAGKASFGSQSFDQKRPPIFLMPGLASTRLVSWKHKSCNNKLLSDVKVQDYVWMNINLLIQMATIDSKCFLECMTLGLNQTDMNDDEIGCKLRPDEGLDAISSIAPGGVTTNMLVGGKNTVYAWLTQWLAENLGYDVSSIVGLPYDWRLSPDIMEKRDGFLTLTRKRIEASVASNGKPGIMVAHSMGNSVFRYFLEWLKNELHEEAYTRLLKSFDKRESIYRGPKKEESTAFVNPGIVSTAKTILQTYFTGEENQQNNVQAGNVFEDFRQWQKSNDGKKHPQLWELAQAEGDEAWLDWIHDHIWTYIGLSAPLLGAINPVRAVVSGENMGMPMTDYDARTMELSFGSTHTIGPISSASGFCDGISDGNDDASNLACLDELIAGIETSGEEDPWKNFPALKSILKERVDWDSTFPTFTVQLEKCNQSERPPCKVYNESYFNAKDVQSGDLFLRFSEIWNEQGAPLRVKRAQLDNSWWQNVLPNNLNSTWDRPHIKHVIMAYGVDFDTEVGYVYRKVDQSKQDEKQFDDMPTMKTIIHEEAGGRLYEENRIEEKKSITDSVLMRKSQNIIRELESSGKGKLKRSGDASVPYLSLAWAHTWLLHATRAMRHSGFKMLQKGERISDDNALDSIKVTYRPKGGSDWLDIAFKNEIELISDADENNDKEQSHPHGTRYKPEMHRYQSKGKSRSTGMEYTTAVIEAVGIEHKETTRNYDILAAVFTDVLENMHDDFDLV